MGLTGSRGCFNRNVLQMDWLVWGQNESTEQHSVRAEQLPDFFIHLLQCAAQFDCLVREVKHSHPQALAFETTQLILRLDFLHWHHLINKIMFCLLETRKCMFCTRQTWGGVNLNKNRVSFKRRQVKPEQISSPKTWLPARGKRRHPFWIWVNNEILLAPSRLVCASSGSKTWIKKKGRRKRIRRSLHFICLLL